jgi:DNA-binding transcriptional LysR family regulator
MVAAAQLGEAETLGGAVRLSVSEGFGTAVVAPALPALRARRPGLRVELAAAPNLLSPSRREVDLAVTLSAPKAARLLVEPLTDYELGLYAAPAYLARAGAPASTAALGEHDLVGYIDDLIHAPELRYLDEVGSGLTPTFASSSIRAQQAVIAAGGGVGVLPCFLGETLARVLPDEVRLTRRFWIATQLEVAETARVRALRTWLRDLVATSGPDCCRARPDTEQPLSQGRPRWLWSPP